MDNETEGLKTEGLKTEGLKTVVPVVKRFEAKKPPILYTWRDHVASEELIRIAVLNDIIFVIEQLGGAVRSNDGMERTINVTISLDPPRPVTPRVEEPKIATPIENPPKVSLEAGIQS